VEGHVTYFHEEQAFSGMLLGALLALVVVPLAFLGFESTQRPVPLVGSLVAIAIFIPIAFIFFATKLVVDVTGNEVRVSFHFVWPTRHIPLAEVRRAQARRYSPLLDYGGWGVRYAFVRGWAFTTGGHDGVLVETTNGKKIMIGSRRAKELESAIARALAERQGR
jgi:hypothetical protein